ncbi:MAG: hypothetical protein UT24_C0038G0006 [Candidatus Woesebacteria bacterium GW2011_GWB1_39_12]|uniref:Uncharacterized protein n=1 Tax=Candidatus Woesebacteria bacterium GW2011_GWB1_39_12 TaxID=1618574 RepID=A0A0G0PJU7_9BACT|nr:MAG: hypothetical protein UT24_C0038G0006 [Candidatus Woesebacteria bacterium GW2011_GWB1_39_12]
MAITKQIILGSITVSMSLIESLPLDFPAIVDVSYGVSSIEEPSFVKYGVLRTTVQASTTIEQMWEAVEAAINAQEGIV